MVALNGDDVNAIGAAHIKFLDGLSHQFPANLDTPDFHAVIQGDVVNEVPGNQALADTHRHIRLRVDHRRPQLLEHLAVFGAGGLGDDMGDAHFNHQHGGQDAHVNGLTDTDGDCVAVLNPGFLQRLLAEGLHHKGVVRVPAHGFDRLLVLIHGDDFLACIGQGFYQGGAEPPQADNTKRCGSILLFHTRFLILL